MPAIHHIPVNVDNITPEAQRVLDRYQEEIPWNHAIPDRAGMRVYDFRVRFESVGGLITRYLTRIPIEEGVRDSYYQVSPTEVLIVECEQHGQHDLAIYSIRLYEGTPEQVDNLFEYPI